VWKAETEACLSHKSLLTSDILPHTTASYLGKTGPFALADISKAPRPAPAAPNGAGSHHLPFYGNSETGSGALKGFTGIGWNVLVCSKAFYTSPVLPFHDRV